MEMIVTNSPESLLKAQKELTAMTMWKVHADGVIDLTKLDVPDWMIDELEKIANE